MYIIPFFDFPYIITQPLHFIKADQSAHFFKMESLTKELINFLSTHNNKSELKNLCEGLEETFIVPKRIFEIRYGIIYIHIYR